MSHCPFPLSIPRHNSNVIISAPGLYGYAAVIFNHPVYDAHMNALSKLVVFSSLIHQLGFLLFSGLDFAIGTVQDAGLIFLSAMAHKIANSMLDDGHSKEEIVTTTLVLLSAGTALLGVCLILVGKFRLADAVSYLPMPVVGGYLAYIGYFCCQAGVALCISIPLITPADWVNLLDPHKLLLAIPGLVAGLILTLASRKISHDAALPLIMVSIPASFYLLLWVTGESMEDAREGGWVGQVAPPVPVSELLKLVNFKLVHWGLWTEIFSTWVGMVFVVSFASCLDVAAISIDMGEALDTNHELATVGVCNRKFSGGQQYKAARQIPHR
jgi:sulfate permease, SulP family